MIDTRYENVRPEYPLANCAAAWANHRWWQRAVWLAFLGWIPFGWLSIETFEILPTRFGLHPLGPLVFVPIAAYCIGLVIIGNRTSGFRCPRCGARFYAFGPWGMGHNGFARKCRNCGLKKWQCGNDA